MNRLFDRFVPYRSLPMPRSHVRVRLALVGIFAVLALGFLVPPGHAQPGRPPGFPSPPRPPSMPAPARPPGAGITGISGAGITGIHGAGISGIHGAGITGIPSPPNFGPSRNEWVCSGCRHVVGTGPIRPNVTTCPSCGARFSNPGVGAPSGGAPNTGGTTGTAPPAAPSEPSLLAPELPPNPAAGTTGTTTAPTEPAPTTAPALPFVPDTNAATPDQPEAKRGSRTILIVGVVGGGLFLIGAMGMLAFVVMKANAPTKSRRPKRRVLELDD